MQQVYFGVTWRMEIAQKYVILFVLVYTIAQSLYYKHIFLGCGIAWISLTIEESVTAMYGKLIMDFIREIYQWYK